MQRDHTNEIDPNAPVTEQATSWWMVLNEGHASSADHRAFGEWVARSPERVEAYLQAARLKQALLSPQTRWPDTSAEELIRMAREASSEVTTLPRSESRGEHEPLGVPSGRARRALGSLERSERRPEGANRDATVRDADERPHALRLARMPGARRIAAAAAFVAILALSTVLYFYLTPQRIQTALGEQRSVVLADGSIVTLNTSSTIEVRMMKDRRTVTLLDGEALFEVAHDKARPFDVRTGDTTVRAVGTQFNVDRRASRTTVTVVEGKVAVFTNPAGTREKEETKLPLVAGEQLTLAPSTVRQPIRTDIATAIAWTQRKLVFEHRQLGEVAEEFNRYNRQTIEIRSADLRHQEVTGVFQANDPASFLSFLSRLPGVSIERSVDRIVVTQK